MMVERVRRPRRAHSIGAALGITGFGADGTHQTPVDQLRLESRANSVSTQTHK